MRIWVLSYTIALTLNLTCHLVSGFSSLAASKAKSDSLARKVRSAYWKPNMAPKWTSISKPDFTGDPDRSNTPLVSRMHYLFDGQRPWLPGDQKNLKSAQAVKAKDLKRLITYPLITSSPHESKNREGPDFPMLRIESLEMSQKPLVFIRNLSKMPTRVMSGFFQYRDRAGVDSFSKRKVGDGLPVAKRNGHTDAGIECTGYLYNCLCRLSIVPGCSLIHHEENCSIETECMRQSVCLPQQLYLASAHCFATSKIFHQEESLNQGWTYDYRISITDNQNNVLNLLSRHNENVTTAQTKVSDRLARILSEDSAFVKFSTWARKRPCSP